LDKNNIIKFEKPKKFDKSSKRAYALYNEGLCFYRQDRDSIALEKFLQSEALGYKSSDMFSFIARIYGTNDEFEKVKEYAQKAIDTDSDYGDPYFLYGGALYESGDIKNALKYYLLAEEHGYDDDIIMFREIAECYGKLGDKYFLKQLEYATKAINLDTENAYSRYWKGWIYFRHNEFSHALKYFLKSENMGYSDISLYYEISYCYSMLDNLKKAVEYADKCIFTDKSDPLGYYRKAFAYFMKEEYGKAKRYYLSAEKRDCKEPDMYIRLGYIYQNEENFEKAVEYSDKTSKLDKKDPDAYILKGNVYASLKKDYITALKYYKKAYKIDNDMTEDFFANFSVLYSMLNRYSSAIKIIDEGLKKYPKSYNLLSIKIGAYQFKKEYDIAEKLTKKLIKLDPKNPWNNYYKALVYYNCKKRKKNYKKVINYIEKIEDSNIRVFGGSDGVLSFAYYEIKEFNKSLEIFYRFLDSEYCDEFIEKNIKEIKRYYKKLLKKFPNEIKLANLAKKFPELLDF